MEFIDYYSVLGVVPTTDAKAIKTAYRKLGRKYHPDVSKLPNTAEMFKRVAEAYAVCEGGNTLFCNSRGKSCFHHQLDDAVTTTGIAPFGAWY